MEKLIVYSTIDLVRFYMNKQVFDNIYRIIYPQWLVKLIHSLDPVRILDL